MRAWFVVGLGFGSEGKGAVIDALCDHLNAPTVLRTTGGAQGSRRISLEGERRHLAQFGAGALAGSPSVLGPDVCLEPIQFLEEAARIEAVVSNPLNRISVDPDCLITTPIHVAFNRCLEFARGERVPDKSQGTAGWGHHETVRLASEGLEIRVRDLDNMDLVRDRLRMMQDHYLQESMDFNDAIEGARHKKIRQNAEFLDQATIMRSRETVAYTLYALGVWRKQVKVVPAEEVLASIQTDVIVDLPGGILLDQDWGPFPFVMHASTGPKPAQELVRKWLPQHEHYKVGVCRPYMVRFGPGPLPSEEAKVKRLGWVPADPSPWVGPPRVGWFDNVLTRYAVSAIGGIDAVAVNCIDQRNAVSNRRDMIDSYADKNNRLVQDLPAPTSPFGTPERLAELNRIWTAAEFYRPLDRSLLWDHSLSQQIGVIVGAPVLMEGRGPDRDKHKVML